jgi:hypothetical protein
MMMIIRYALLALLALVAASCTSPLEVDTPRDKALDSLATPTTVRATAIELEFNKVGAAGTHVFTASGTAVIDTGKTVPDVWLTITGAAPAGTLTTMPLRSITIHIDSAMAGSAPIAIVGIPSDPIGAELITQIPGTVQRTINPDGTTCTLSLLFTINRPAHTLTAAIATDFHPSGTSLPMSGTLTLRY